MKKHYIKYFLVALILLGISGGCERTPSYRDFEISGLVWWGDKVAIGDSVEAIFGYAQATSTDSSGGYYFFYHAADEQVDYKVRAKDSLGVWSGYKEGTINSDNPTAEVDFHL